MSVLLLPVFAVIMTNMGTLFFFRKDVSPLERVLLSFFVGIAVWGMAGTVMGLFDLFKPGAVLGLFSIALVVSSLKDSRPEWRLAYREFIQVFRDLWMVSGGWRTILVFSILLVSMGLASLGKSSIGDAAAFYLPLAKTLAYSGELRPLPGYEIFSSVGFVGEIQMATLMMGGFEDAARLLNWFVFLPAALLLLMLLRRRNVSYEGQIFLLAALFSSSAIFNLFGDGKVDLFSAALGIAVYFLIFETSGSIIAGVLAASACIAKLSFLVTLGPSVALVLLWKHGRLDSALLNGLKILVGFVLVLSHHMLKNQMFFGSPFAPFGLEGSQYVFEAAWFSAETVRGIVRAYPLVWFFGSFWGQLGTLSPIILAFLPFALNRRSFNPRLWNWSDAMFWSALCGVIAWAVLRPSFIAPRYIFATLLLFAVVSSVGVQNFLQGLCCRKTRNGIAVSIICLFTIFAITRVPGTGSRFERAFMHLISSDPCGREGEHCLAAVKINELAAMNARVLQLTYFTYWLRPDLLRVMAGESESGLRKFNWKSLGEHHSDDRSLNDWWQWVYQGKFEYLLVDPAYPGANGFSKDLAPSWVRLQSLYESDKVKSYKIIFFGERPLEKRWRKAN